jgi:hypothetical protein
VEKRSAFRRFAFLRLGNSHWREFAPSCQLLRGHAGTPGTRERQPVTVALRFSALRLLGFDIGDAILRTALREQVGNR